MSSAIDPAKLKVVELRTELTARGLDTKGNKAVLVKRLKDALEKELQQELPDTSIVDTSTEELNSSQGSISEPVKPNNDESLKQDNLKSDDVEMKETEEGKEAASEESLANEEKQEEEEELVENGDDAEKVEEEPKEEKPEEAEDNLKNEEEKEKAEQNDQRGEKRHRSPSPSAVHSKRARTPIKENEPDIDKDKVQLSWYDCDLHLNIDKQSFLSAKPYHEGAFGYAWAGARTTHGITTGKARFEVKITESLKWEEIIRPLTKKEIARRAQRNKRDEMRNDKKKQDKKHQEQKSEDNESKVDNENDVDREKQEDVKNGEDKSEKMDTETSDVSGQVSEEGKSDNKEEINDKSDDKEEKIDDREEKMDDKEEKMNDKEEKMDDKEEKIDDKEEKSDDKDAMQEEEKHEEEEEVIEPLVTHLIRVGWSLPETSLQLGESDKSFAYESSGKFITNGQFEDYGEKAEVGDVIGAYVDITDENVRFSFTINGKLQADVKTIPKPDDFVLFPHVLSKNYAFEVNTGTREEPWFPNPEELKEYAFVHEITDKVAGPCRPEKREDCEVVMMCGLPGSGKTHWVKQWLLDHPDKKYTLIGNSHLLERMTINGKPLKTRYEGRWNEIMDKIIRCMNHLVKTASVRRRNYILDQTNVLPTAQREKMRLFEGFKRRAVVVVVTDEEQAKREAQQEAQGVKDLPELAVLEMKAMMGLPKTCDWLNEVDYAELNEEESKTMVQKYNKEGRDAGFKPFPERRDTRFTINKWDHNSSRRYQGSYNRNYGYNRGGWNNRRSSSGSWNQDVRNRGPPNRDWGRQQNRSGQQNRNNNYNRSQRSGGGSWQGGSGNWQGQGSGSWNNQSGQAWSGGSPWSSQGGQWKGNYGQGYNQDYGQGYGSYSNWGDYYRYGYDQGGWNSQNSQYSGGYGDNYPQYQNNSSWSQGHGGGKYNRK